RRDRPRAHPGVCYGAFGRHRSPLGCRGDALPAAPRKGIMTPGRPGKGARASPLPLRRAPVGGRGLMREVETILLGGGPAGSRCARELTRAGRRCLVLERQAMPRVKLCGGWVTPKALADLGARPDDYPHGLVRLHALKVFFGRRHRWSWTARCEQYS